jgi:hypothetical protein
MRVTFLLLALISAGLSVAIFGPVLSVPLLVSAGLVVASVLWLAAERRKRAPTRWIVVDGSNVMYWADETPSLDTVRKVVTALRAEGFQPVVWFDANAGYLTMGRYLGPDLLSGQIGVARRQVFVAEKGVPADPLILRGAERLGARVVTNDRYRDWVERFPQVQEPGFLVRGRIRDGAVLLRLEVPAAEADRPAAHSGRVAPRSR